MARLYSERAAVEVARRWRCKDGEIDLVFLEGDILVFTEVKARRRLEDALASLSPRQLVRLQNAAIRYQEATGCNIGQITRFDLAVVDQSGRAQIVENITID